MNTRAHHEAQIKRFDTLFGREFQKAVGTLLDVNWLTDEQIADVREVMLLNELRRRRNNAVNRKAYAERRSA